MKRLLRKLDHPVVPLAVFAAIATLKLTSVITWSWWVITAPLWIPAGGTILLLGYAAVVISTFKDDELDAFPYGGNE